MKLNQIQKITGSLTIITGLHIGSGNSEIHIGGTDNPVIKNPLTQQPYIPGSSIKGKMRSLLEWELGVVGITEGKPLGFGHIDDIHSDEDKKQAKNILKLFGGAPLPNTDNELIKEIGPTRISFWDCELQEEWVKKQESKNLLLTEVKMENTIDRIAGTAENPRNTERVPAGAIFNFQLSLRIHDDEQLIDTILHGLSLLELTGLGGSGSRGYGKISIQLDDSELQNKLTAQYSNAA
jgi:CRISPR-associated protein Csm3